MGETMASRKNSDSLSNGRAAMEAAHLIDRLERLSRSGVAVKGLNGAQWEALRYLDRANRFSRTPAALSDYLGSTRGTVSQTLISLGQKGFVSRQPSARDRRSVALGLTKAGEEALVHDPLRAIANDIADATDGVALADALRSVLRMTIRRNNGRPFGVCRSCKYFEPQAAGGSPHFCGLLHEPLSAGDSDLICMEQEDA